MLALNDKIVSFRPRDQSSEYIKISSKGDSVGRRERVEWSNII